METDESLPLFRLELITVYGLDESDPRDATVAVAKALDVSRQPKSEPKRNVFI
jgi:hypothetical protein